MQIIMNDSAEAYATPGLNNSDDVIPLSAYWQSQVHDFLFRYVAPVLLCAGTVGNLLCLVVLQSRLFRNTPYALLLCALAVADLGVLQTGLLRQVVKTTAHVDIRLMSRLGCKLHYFLTYFCPQLSSWTLVLVTFERLVSLTAPFHLVIVVSRKRALIMWSLVATFLALVNLHWLVTVNIRSTFYAGNQSFLFCTYAPSTRYFSQVVWSWLDFLLLTLIPTFIILPSNIIILLKVRASRRARSRSLGGHGPDNTIASVTAMLLVVSFVFVLTTAPLAVYFLGLSAWPLHTPRGIADTQLAYAICSVLFYTNSSVNFLLYTVCGTRFRSALEAMLCCQGRVTVHRIHGVVRYSPSRSSLVAVNAVMAPRASFLLSKLGKLAVRHKPPSDDQEILRNVVGRT